MVVHRRDGDIYVKVQTTCKQGHVVIIDLCFNIAVLNSSLYPGHAVRQCGVDGRWVSHFDDNMTDGWTNYTECFKEDPEIASIKV